MVERFEASIHRPTVDVWIRARGLGEDLGDAEMYPPVGFMVDGCAVGFLFQTDCKQAYIGAFVSDPGVDAPRRGRALDALIETLCAEAKERGYRAVSALPTIHTLSMRFGKHGFTTIPGHYSVRRI